MKFHVSEMPLWAVIIFILSFLGSIVWLTKPVKRAALAAGGTLRQATHIQWGVLFFYLGYLTYVSLFALRGVFDVNSLPPKVTILASLPLAAMLFGYIGNTKTFKTVLGAFSLENLISLHLFRLLGVFFILIYAYRLLPAPFAFSAGLGDILTALLAWPVARLVAKRGRGWKTALYAWSIFGIMDIVDLLVIAVLVGANGNLREMTVFPFVWFPAFAPATILFLHAAVFRRFHQLEKKQDQGAAQ